MGASHDALLYGTPVGKADSTCTSSGHSGRQKTMIKCAICTGALKIALRSDKLSLCLWLRYRQIVWLCLNSMRAKRWSPLCWWSKIILSQWDLKNVFWSINSNGHISSVNANGNHISKNPPTFLVGCDCTGLWLYRNDVFFLLFFQSLHKLLFFT